MSGRSGARYRLGSSSDYRSHRAMGGGDGRSRSGSSYTPRLDRAPLSSISAGSGSRSGRRSASSGPSPSWSGRSSRTPGSTTPRPRHSTTVLALVAGRGQATGAVGLAALDPESPVLVLAQISDSYTYSRVIAKINVLNPCQILLPNTLCEPGQPLYRLLCEQFADATMTSLPRHHFQSEAGRERVAALCLPSLASVPAALQSMYYCATAASALLLYMESVRSVAFRPHTLKVEIQPAEAAVMINSDTCRRLELVQSCSPGGRPEQTVYGVLRRTQTPGGCRRLRAELLQPSVSRTAIRTRQDCVQELVDSPDLLYLLRAVIGRFRDVEKIHSFCIQQHDWNTERNVEQRLNHIIALKASLECVDALREALQSAQHPFFVSMKECVSEPLLATLLDRLRQVVHDDVQPCRGGVEQRVQRCYAIKAGINGMLDVARRLYSEAYDEFVSYVAQLGEHHRLALRAGYNATRGFHAIASVARGSRPPRLPDEFIQVHHNQSSFTFTTEAIVQTNSRADASVLEICQLSNIVVCELLTQLQPDLCCLYTLAEVVSTVDLLVGLADVAVSQDLRRPLLGRQLKIVGGWHPLLAAAETAPLTPTTLELDEDCRLVIITGANMSGKSTLLKLVAIVQILTQLGSFVPAESAVVPLADQIFCRAGCEERAERHASAFQTEMWDLSSALQQATPRSLVLLDELGRSTAAEEGTGVAWAACEALLRRRCRALAATHFPALARLADVYHGVANFHVGRCEGDAPAVAPADPAAGAHAVFPGPLRLSGYGLRLAATTSLPEELLDHAGRLLATVLTPPPPVKVTARRRQERQIVSLAARLAQLTDAGLAPDALRQELRQLRQQFVQSQLAPGADADEAPEPLGRPAREAEGNAENNMEVEG